MSRVPLRFALSFASIAPGSIVSSSKCATDECDLHSVEVLWTCCALWARYEKTPPTLDGDDGLVDGRVTSRDVVRP